MSVGDLLLQENDNEHRLLFCKSVGFSHIPYDNLVIQLLRLIKEVSPLVSDPSNIDSRLSQFTKTINYSRDSILENKVVHDI